MRWGLDRWQKYPGNPILAPREGGWESRAVYNPAAWSDGQQVYLLYRAEGPCDFSGREWTSRIGLATSSDGIRFTREPRPVLEPTEPYEVPGGCEDPRLARIDGTFYLTYTAYDGHVARLALAVSDDLRSWEKRGVVFPDAEWERFFPHEAHRRLFARGWSKSGAILDQPVNGRYWMFFGDTHIWAAWSADLRRWEVVAEPVLSPREGQFDAGLVEPGPPPRMLAEGIWMGYNAADAGLRYSFGQALFDLNDPTRLIRRSDRPILEPSAPGEIAGQVPNVLFAEGLVSFQGRDLLYYGMADSRIGLAIGIE
jgi:predicted GH43/DUF377 family glycosyl hydrolase